LLHYFSYLWLYFSAKIAELLLSEKSAQKLGKCRTFTTGALQLLLLLKSLMADDNNWMC